MYSISSTITKALLMNLEQKAKCEETQKRAVVYGKLDQASPRRLWD